MSKVQPQFRFAAPASRPKPHLWTVNRIGEPTSYLCLRAHLSQAVLNRLTLGFILLCVFVHIFYLAAVAQIDSSRNFAVQVCGLLSGGTLAGTQNDALTNLQHSTNLSVSRSTQYGLGMLASEVANLRESSLGQANLITYFYASASDQLANTADAAVGNTTLAINDWLEPRMVKAQDMANTLMDAFSQVGDALKTSGLFSMNRTDVGSIFNISAPTIKPLVFKEVDLGPISDYTKAQIQDEVGRASEKLKLVTVAPLSPVSMKVVSNITTVQCAQVVPFFKSMRKSCSSIHAGAEAAFAILAFISLLISVVTRVLDWRQTEASCREFEEQLNHSRFDTVIDPMEALCKSQSCLKHIAGKVAESCFCSKKRIHVAWTVSYLTSSTFGFWVLSTFWVFLVAIPTSILNSQLKKSLSLVAGTSESQQPEIYIQTAINGQIAERENALNTAVRDIMGSTNSAITSILSNCSSQLQQVLNNRFKDSVVNLQGITNLAANDTRMAVPKLLLPRLDNATLALYTSAGSGNKIELDSVSVLGRVSAALWTTFGVMAGVAFLWCFAAVAYAYLVSKVNPAGDSNLRTFNTQVVVSKSSEETLAEPLSPPILPPRDAKRPNYFI